jgi:hypothetical protein
MALFWVFPACFCGAHFATLFLCLCGGCPFVGVFAIWRAGAPLFEIAWGYGVFTVPSNDTATMIEIALIKINGNCPAWLDVPWQ